MKLKPAHYESNGCIVRKTSKLDNNYPKGLLFIQNTLYEKENCSLELKTHLEFKKLSIIEKVDILKTSKRPYM